ncbi:MAG: hypothetical protein FWE41_04845 [Coriobacteriia bacterium]|nr:hypothetical protein [Coriobacteriia bacterium]MCL2750353.1 hypothetical protein [Coriobacteriia bacterium]
MLQGAPKSFRVVPRVMGKTIMTAALAACMLFSVPLAYASFSSESAEQILGVGRIQSSATLSTSQLSGATHFAAPEHLVVEPTLAVTQLAQPLDRGIENPERAIEAISLIQRFGEPDADGWWSVKTSAYGPSSAGTHTALGTELTMTSMDIGVHINHIDLLGRHVYLMYGDVILKCRIVDTGELAPDGRLWDLQPGVCTAFGAETPEFGWGIRWVKWKFAD